MPQPIQGGLRLQTKLLQQSVIQERRFAHRATAVRIRRDQVHRSRTSAHSMGAANAFPDRSSHKTQAQELEPARSQGEGLTGLKRMREGPFVSSKLTHYKRPRTVTNVDNPLDVPLQSFLIPRGNQGCSAKTVNFGYKAIRITCH